MATVTLARFKSNCWRAERKVLLEAERWTSKLHKEERERERERELAALIERKIEFGVVIS